MSEPSRIIKTSKKAKIVSPEIGLNKKLAGLKFNQIFDTKDLHEAENVITKNQGLFKAETLKDYSALKDFYNSCNLESLTKQGYEKFSEHAFSIKSRAGTGGFPLISEVANSLYQFCDKAALSLPANGNKVVALHFNAISEILEGKFDSKDLIKSTKLVSGLTEISNKFLAN